MPFSLNKIILIFIILFCPYGPMYWSMPSYEQSRVEYAPNKFAELWTPRTHSGKLVFLINGKDFWRKNDLKSMHSLAKALVDNGFNVLNLEYSLAPDAQFPTQINEFETAIKWVKKHKSAESMDLYAWGEAFGAQITAIGVFNKVKYPFKGVVLGNPITDLTQYSDANLADYLGEKDFLSNVLAGSPLYNVNSKVPPTFIYEESSSKQRKVQSYALYEDLVSKNKSVEYHELNFFVNIYNWVFKRDYVSRGILFIKNA